MIQRRRRALCLLTLGGLLALSGCASTPREGVPIARPPRAGITHFSLEARAAISQPQRADSLRLSWQHSPHEDVLGFASPLGSTLAELQRNAQGSRWTAANGEYFEAPRPDELFARLTVVPVPLDALSEWMLGRVTNGARDIQRDAGGRLVAATDLGWSVRVLTYESEAVDALPGVIELGYDMIRIRVAIESWNL